MSALLTTVVAIVIGISLVVLVFAMATMFLIEVSDIEATYAWLERINGPTKKQMRSFACDESLENNQRGIH